jgi:hypothetical protein
MRPLSAPELLDVWERGAGRPAAERVLALVIAAWSEAEAAASLTVGQRDACLLDLREWSFGRRLEAAATCASCGEQLEFEADVADLRVPHAPVEATDVLDARLAGFEVRFRLPNSLDAVAGAQQGDVSSAKEALLERCLVAASCDGEPVPAAGLPQAVVDAIGARMAEADPQADVQLLLACPACGHEWQTTFDIGVFLLGEIDAWAHHLLWEVHTLASAYGWREADLLALSPWRRRYYLEMAGR